MAQTLFSQMFLIVLKAQCQLIFQCPTVWNVDQAKGRIRSRYGIRGGGIEHNGVPVLGTALISSFTGNLVFVGGQSFQPPSK